MKVAVTEIFFVGVESNKRYDKIDYFKLTVKEVVYKNA